MAKSNTIPVFLSSDSNYAPYVAALMVSILENTKSAVDFYILDAGIGAHNKKLIELLHNTYTFGLEFIDVEKYRHLFNMPATPSGYVTRASSDRFLIPYIKPKLDKIIILDVDMIALGDIQKLWDIDLGDEILGAVPEYVWINKQIAIEHCTIADIPHQHVFFNMGTLLVNTKKWRDEKITEKISNYNITFDTKKYCWWDEILLNKILSVNNYKILDPKFNMMVPHQAYYKFGQPNSHKQVIEEYCGLSPNYQIQEIILAHYVMPHIKPWNTRIYFYEPANQWMDIPNFKDFWYYMRKTPFFDAENITFIDKQLSNLFVGINKTHTALDTAVNNLNQKYSEGLSEGLNLLNKHDTIYTQKLYNRYKILNILCLGVVSKYRKKVKQLKAELDV